MSYLKQKSPYVVEESTEFTTEYLGEVIFNSPDPINIELPVVQKGLWFHGLNDGAGLVTVKNNDSEGGATITTISQQEECYFYIVAGNWTYFKNGAGGGDMTKAVYDTDDDGAVDEAQSANEARGITFPSPEAADDEKYLKYDHDTLAYVLDTPTSAPDKTTYLAKWDSTVTYAAGDPCTVGSAVFMSLQNGNLNNEPDATHGTWWGYHTLLSTTNGTTGQVLTKSGNEYDEYGWANAGTGDMDKATYDNNSDGKVDEADTADAGKGTDFPTAGSGDDGKFLKYVHATTEYVLDTPDTSDFDDLSPMTTEGDIIYGGVSGTGTRLGKGTEGHFLKQGASIPEWAAVPDPTKTQIEAVLTGEISSHTHAASKPELTEETYLYVGYYEELTGTISATGTAVTGTSTLFTSELSVGDIIAFVDDGEGYYELRAVDSITDNTNLVLTEVLEYEYTDITYSVAKAGDDDNDGSAGDADHALATIQKAVDIVSGYNVKTDVYIEVAAKTYNENVLIQEIQGLHSNMIDIYNPYLSYMDDARYVVIDNVTIMYNDCQISVTNLNITGQLLIGGSHVNITTCAIDEGGVSVANQNTYVNLTYCNIVHDDSGTALSVTDGAEVYFDESIADGDIGLKAERGGRIYKNAASVVGDVEISTGGQIYDLAHGTTAERPERLPVGYQYFDTTLGHPIWYLGWAQGSVTDWVDATGAEV